MGAGDNLRGFQRSRGCQECRPRKEWSSTTSFAAPRSFVLSLLFGSGPSAIVWLVMAVVVYSVNAVFWRRRVAHVRVESVKAFQPPITDPDASRSVVLPADTPGIVASVLHSIPRSVDLCAAHAVGDRRSLSAPTTLDLARPEVPCCDFCRVPARAKAGPISSAALPKKAGLCWFDGY